MLIVGDVMFPDQFMMRTSKKYVSNFFDNFFLKSKVNVKGQNP